jgi:uncharacterized membrane protein YbhN (UPF0104 family)
VNKFLRLAVSAGLLGLLGWKTDWSEVGVKFADLHVEMWFAAVGFLVLAQVASARRWQRFAEELRFERTFQQYCSLYLVGTYFNLMLPTSVGGDVVRVLYLDGKSGRRWAALASVFLERLNGLLVLIAVACVGILLAPSDLNLPWWIPASVWGIAACATLGMASIPLTRNMRILPDQRREQLLLAWDLLRSPKLLTETTFMSVLVQLAGAAIVACVGAGLGLDVPLAYYCVLGPLVSLLTLLPVSFNGMGLREWGTVVFLAPLGVDKSTALTLAFLWFAVNVAVSLLGGLVYLVGAEAPVTEGTNDHGFVDRNPDQGREGQPAQAA